MGWIATPIGLQPSMTPCAAGCPDLSATPPPSSVTEMPLTATPTPRP